MNRQTDKGGLDGREHGQPTPVLRNPRPSARGTAAYQRRRAVKACQVCRARRTKCDNLKPSCSFCLKVGAVCVQSAVDLSSFDAASLKILERLDDLEELLKRPVLEQDVAPSRGQKGSATKLESQRSRPSLLDGVLPPSLEAIMSWPCFQSTLRYPSQASRPETRPTLPLFSVFRMANLDFDQLQHLVDAFFEYVHVKNPIFDEKDTRDLVHTTLTHGIDWSAKSCLSLLICALGSIATPFGASYDSMPGTSAYNNAVCLFQEAEKRLGMVFSIDDIIAPQCLFLSGVFMMCLIQPAKAWRYFVQTLAHCQQPNKLGMADTGTNVADQPQALGAFQQSIYWSAWKSEKELRHSLRPPDFPISTDPEVNLYPSFFPTPPLPSGDDEASPGVDRQREVTEWYFYLAEISLRRLSTRIAVEMVQCFQSQATRQDFLRELAAIVPVYEAQVQEWVKSLPHNMSFDRPAEEDDVCRFVLRGHAIDVSEMIHWPFLSAYLDTATAVPGSLVPHADLVQRGLENHSLRLQVNKPGFKHRHHGTHPMIEACCRSAVILQAAATANANGFPNNQSSYRSLSMPPGWETGIRDVLNLIDFWSPETVEFQDVRTALQTDVTVS